MPAPLTVLSGAGPNPQTRVKADVARTAFWEGREFRAGYEFSIAAGATQVLRVTAPGDFILLAQGLSVDSGSVRFSAALGGTPGGSFSSSIQVFGRNRMSVVSPVPVSALLLDTGGTHTGGVESEVIRVANAGPGVQTVAVGAQSERGLPAGTYYLRLFNYGVGTCTGVYTLSWEEFMAS